MFAKIVPPKVSFHIHGRSFYLRTADLSSIKTPQVPISQSHPRIRIDTHREREYDEIPQAGRVIAALDIQGRGKSALHRAQRRVTPGTG
jgi:hypothetical protein